MKRAVCASLFMVAALALCPVSSPAASSDYVHEYFKVIGASENLDRLIPILNRRLAIELKRVFQEFFQDEQELIPQILTDARSQMIEAELPVMEKIFADNLTDGEIIAAIKFQRSPEGRSVLQKQQAAMEQRIMGQDVIIDLTHAEATAMENFSQSPNGYTFLKKLPGIVQQYMQAAPAAVAPLLPELQQRLRDELKKRHPDLK